MMKLKCVSRYVNEPQQLAFNAGDVFDASPALAQFLKADSPGSFSDYDPAQEFAPLTKPAKPAKVK
jgi:hypothetical protein